MKYLVLFFCLISSIAFAAGPAGKAGDLQINGGNGTFATASGGQPALNDLFNTPVGTAAPALPPCTGGGAETAFRIANISAQANHSSILYPGGSIQPCQLNNQWQLSQDTFVSVFTWGGGAIDFNTARSNGGSAAPYILVNSQTEAQTAPGAAAIDMNGARQFNLNGAYIWGTSLGEPSTLIENSVQDGTCCASNNITSTGGSFGSTSAVLGTPLDGNFHPILVGGIYSGNITAPGSGYVNGTYNAVPLTGGTGTGAVADQIVVAGNVVTSVLIRDTNGITFPGGAYTVGDVLSASNTNLGNSGSGFHFTVTALTKATSTTANTLPRFLGVQFSDIGTCVLCNNFSDLMMWNFQMSGVAGVGIYPIFGGGGNDIGPGRMEFMRKSIWLGGPDASTINSSRIHDITFDNDGQDYDTPYRTANLSTIEIDAGDGYNISNNQHYRPQSTDPVIKLGGTGANAKLMDVIVTGVNMPAIFGGGVQKSCIEIDNGGDGTPPDHIIIDDLVCNPGNDATPVKFNVTPTNSFFNVFGSGHVTDSDHTGKSLLWDDTGRSWGIGTASPPAGNNVFELAAAQTTTGAVLSLSNTTTGGGKLIVGSGGSSSLTLTTTGNVLTLANTSGTCTHTPGSSSETVSCSSDMKFKENIKRAPFFSGWLWDFHIKKYMLKATGEQTIGVIAQELQQNHPEMVHEEVDANGEKFLTVDQPNIWRLVKALQELQLFALIVSLIAIGSVLFHIFHHVKYHKRKPDYE